MPSFIESPFCTKVEYDAAMALPADERAAAFASAARPRGGADPSALQASKLVERPALGGRATDDRGVNCGLLRCPRCFSRMVSKNGELKERHGSDAALWIPSRSSENGTSSGEPEDDEDISWSERPHTWWWRIVSMDDVDNLGLSRVVSAPCGSLKLVMCVECNYGPIGYQLEEEACIWVACDMVHQQDSSMAEDGEDFRAPAGIDMNMLQAMIESGMAIVQFHVTFDEQVLGMQLADAPDGDGVLVHAFTERDGAALPAELSGQIIVGDKVSRVNGRSTSGLDYVAVLDLVREATRPVTIHFERRSNQRAPQTAAPRAPHVDWRADPEPPSSSP